MGPLKFVCFLADLKTLDFKEETAKATLQKFVL